LRIALFWVIMQQVVTILYWCYRTPYWSPEDGADMLSHNVNKKLPLLTV